MLNTQVMEGASRSQHGNHARPVGFKAGHQHIRALAKFGGNRGEIGEGENAIGKDHAIHILGHHLLCLFLGHLYGIDNPLAQDKLYLSGIPQGIYHIVVLPFYNGLEQLKGFGITVRKRENTNFGFGNHCVTSLCNLVLVAYNRGNGPWQFHGKNKVDLVLPAKKDCQEFANLYLHTLSIPKTYYKTLNRN